VVEADVVLTQTLPNLCQKPTHGRARRERSAAGEVGTGQPFRLTSNESCPHLPQKDGFNRSQNSDRAYPLDDFCGNVDIRRF